jgi:hypothetical protein
MNYQHSITLFYGAYTEKMANWVKTLGNAYTTSSPFVVRIDFKSGEDLIAFKLSFGL